jgi:hypothetical protein
VRAPRRRGRGQTQVVLSSAVLCAVRGNRTLAVRSSSGAACRRTAQSAHSLVDGMRRVVHDKRLLRLLPARQQPCGHQQTAQVPARQAPGAPCPPPPGPGRPPRSSFDAIQPALEASSALPSRNTLDGCWVLGAGCWVLGAGCWVLGAPRTCPPSRLHGEIPTCGHPGSSEPCP